MHQFVFVCLFLVAQQSSNKMRDFVSLSPCFAAKVMVFLECLRFANLKFLFCDEKSEPSVVGDSQKAI